MLVRLLDFVEDVLASRGVHVSPAAITRVDPGQNTMPTVKASRTHRLPGHPNRAVIAQRVLYRTLNEVLGGYFGGRATRQKVLPEMRNRLAGSLSDADLERGSAGTERWQERTDMLVYLMRRRGRIEP